MTNFVVNFDFRGEPVKVLVQGIVACYGGFRKMTKIIFIRKIVIDMISHHIQSNFNQRKLNVLNHKMMEKSADLVMKSVEIKQSELFLFFF